MSKEIDLDNCGFLQFKLMSGKKILINIISIQAVLPAGEISNSKINREFRQGGSDVFFGVADCLNGNISHQQKLELLREGAYSQNMICCWVTAEPEEIFEQLSRFSRWKKGEKKP